MNCVTSFIADLRMLSPSKIIFLLLVIISTQYDIEVLTTILYALNWAIYFIRLSKEFYIVHAWIK